MPSRHDRIVETHMTREIASYEGFSLGQRHAVAVIREENSRHANSVGYPIRTLRSLRGPPHITHIRRLGQLSPRLDPTAVATYFSPKPL